VVTATPVPPPIKTEGPVVIGLSEMGADDFNPIQTTYDSPITPMLLPGLTWFEADTQPFPHLAEEIEVSDDATLYTFRLPQDAAWSDGEPVTAEDVAFSYEMANRLSSPWHARLETIRGVAEHHEGETSHIEGITALDDHTVQFELAGPEPDFLGYTFLGIMPEHVLGNVPPERLAAHPYMDALSVTSGPYTLVANDSDRHIHLKKKEGYWGKEPAVDQLIFKIVPDETARFAQLEAAEIDVARFPREKMEQVESVPHVDVLVVESMSYYVLHIDARTEEYIARLNEFHGGLIYIETEPKPYLQDERFRQALAYAIDVEPIIEEVGGGYGEPIYSPIFGPEWAANPDLETYSQDIEKAKQLLQEVGFSFDHNGAALWEYDPITLVFLAEVSEEQLRIGEILQQQLASIGIRLDIQLVSSDVFWEAATGGDGDLISTVGGGFTADFRVPELDYVCHDALWSRFVTGYCNERLDVLFEKAAEASDVETQQRLYWEASAILNDELPGLFLFSRPVFWAVNKGLRGVEATDGNHVTHSIREWRWQE
jgi:peptide/nickel transport system substrate-binding protein